VAFKAINFKEKPSNLSDHWLPKIITPMNMGGAGGEMTADDDVWI
jgi:hypothetical protein